MKRIAAVLLCLALCLPVTGLGEEYLVSESSGVSATANSASGGSAAFRAALAKLNEGSLLEAANAFTGLGTADGANLYAAYLQGLLLLQRDDPAEAAEQFSGLGGFLDSAYRLALSQGLQKHRYVQDGKFGYVDFAGAWVVAPRYDWAERVFRAESARTHDRNDAAFAPEDAYTVAAVYNGTTTVGEEDTVPLEGRYGLVRSDGTLVVPVEYADVLWTVAGFAAVTDGKNCYLYNLSTAAPVGDAYEEVGGYAQGYVNVKQNGLWGYLNPETGDWLGDGCVWESALPFSEGMAAVSLGGLYGFVDLTGRTVIDPQYADAASFGEGLAGVKVAKRWGFVNAKNEMTVQPAYTAVKVFRYGLCAVRRDELWGLINADGTIVLKIKYVEIGEFDPVVRRAWFKQNKLWGLVAADGTVVLKPAWGSHDEFNGNTLCRVAYKGKYGFIDAGGKARVLADYDAASPYRAGVAAVKNADGSVSYINKVKNAFSVETNVPVECRCGFIEGRTITETEHTAADENGETQTAVERSIAYRLYGLTGQPVSVARYEGD